MDEATLFPVARTDDPDTSWEAARSVTGLRDKQTAVLRTIAKLGKGTDEDIFLHYEQIPQSVSGLRTRRSELVHLGLVRDSGERRRSASGRLSIVWEINERGTHA